ncbi:MAG: hypothetical protein ABIM89_00965 [Mycobacteriales bacterium]
MSGGVLAEAVAVAVALLFGAAVLLDEEARLEVVLADGDPAVVGPGESEAALALADVAEAGADVVVAGDGAAEGGDCFFSLVHPVAATRTTTQKATRVMRDMATRVPAPMTPARGTGSGCTR